MPGAFTEQFAIVRFKMPGPDRAASPGGNLQGLANYFTLTGLFPCQRSVRIQHELCRLAKVLTRLLKCGALRVRAGELLHERDVAFRNLLEHRRQRHFRCFSPNHGTWACRLTRRCSCRPTARSN